MWKLLSDPAGFVVDHWPAIVVILFAISIPFFWKEYLILLRAKTTWFILGVFAIIAMTWTVRGRWDNDQFDKERASFHETLMEIDEQNQQATNEARAANEAKEVQGRQNLKDAFLQFQIDTTETPEDIDVQKMIDAMPVAPASPAECPVDPVLQRILRGKK